MAIFNNVADGYEFHFELTEWKFNEHKVVRIPLDEHLFQKLETLYYWLPRAIAKNKSSCTEDIAQWIVKNCSLPYDFVLENIDDLVRSHESSDSCCDVELHFIYKFENGTIQKGV